MVDDGSTAPAPGEPSAPPMATDVPAEGQGEQAGVDPGEAEGNDNIREGNVGGLMGGPRGTGGGPPGA